MDATVATGVPVWPDVSHSSFDWLPLLLVLAALVLAPLVFGIRLSAGSLICLSMGGTLVGWLGDSIGVVPAVAIGLIALAIASAWLRRTQTRRS
ncbi:MAG TPA: hypothetical protein VF195_12615 [Actinomycetota bacterium]